MSGSQPAGRVTPAARWTLSVVFLVLAATKLLGGDTPPFAEAGSLTELLAAREVVLGSAVLDATLAVGLATSHWTFAVRGVVAWIAVLTGLLAAETFTGGLTAPCGCFGPRAVPWIVRCGVLAGLALVAIVALRGAAHGDDRTGRV